MNGNKAPLDATILKFDLIVQLQKVEEKSIPDRVKALKGYLDEKARIYGIAVHDKDFNEDGTRKGLHCHACWEMKKRTRVSTVINQVSKRMGVDTFAVTVERTATFAGAFQYLIHKGKPNKHQYPYDIIVTNLTKEEGDIYMEMSTTTAITFDDLKRIILQCTNMLDVIEMVGVQYYQRYHVTIMDMWNLVHKEEYRLEKASRKEF